MSTTFINFLLIVVGIWLAVAIGADVLKARFYVQAAETIPELRNAINASEDAKKEKLDEVLSRLKSIDEKLSNK